MRNEASFSAIVLVVAKVCLCRRFFFDLTSPLTERVPHGPHCCGKKISARAQVPRRFLTSSFNPPPKSFPKEKKLLCNSFPPLPPPYESHDVFFLVIRKKKESFCWRPKVSSHILSLVSPSLSSSPPHRRSRRRNYLARVRPRHPRHLRQSFAQDFDVAYLEFTIGIPDGGRRKDGIASLGASHNPSMHRGSSWDWPSICYRCRSHSTSTCPASTRRHWTPAQAQKSLHTCQHSITRSTSALVTLVSLVLPRLAHHASSRSHVQPFAAFDKSSTNPPALGH